MVTEYVLKKTPYRWLMLLLLLWSNFSVNYAQFQFTVFSGPFMTDFGINTTQYSAVVLSYAVMAALIGLVGGALADRYGPKRVIVVLAFISAFAALTRLFTMNYSLFLILSALTGAFIGGGTAIAGKIIGAWFAPKEINLAFCFYCAGAALGICVAQATSFIYDGYAQALLVSGLIIVAGAVLWLLLGRNAPEGAPVMPGQPLLKYVKHVVRIKNFWLVAAGCMLFMFTIYTISAMMPVAFIQGKGINPAVAGSYSSTLTLASLIGSVAIPFVQARLGKLRPLLISFNLIAAVFFLLIWSVNGTTIVVMTLLAGLFSCVGAPFFMAMLPRFPEIGTEYAGSANGILSFVQYGIGSFLLPTFLLIPFIGVHYQILFYACAASCVLMALCALLLPEVGGHGVARKAMNS
jgi:NNP family nitrate/nitrite transporter-like MFS transporter